MPGLCQAPLLQGGGSASRRLYSLPACIYKRTKFDLCRNIPVILLASVHSLQNADRGFGNTACYKRKSFTGKYLICVLLQFLWCLSAVLVMMIMGVRADGGGGFVYSFFY